MGCLEVSIRLVSKPINVSLQQQGGMSVSLSQFCNIIPFKPYLEIEPEIIWLADWGATNDVFSNTHWGID